MSDDTTFLEDALALLTAEPDAPAVVVRVSLDAPTKMLTNTDDPDFLFAFAKLLLGVTVQRATAHGNLTLANQADAALEGLGKQPILHSISFAQAPDR